MGSLASAQYAFAPALASALLHAVWQDALIGVAAALALRAMAAGKAAARHNLAMAFLAAMVLVPAVQFLRFWQEPGALVEGGLLPAMIADGGGAPAGTFVQRSSPAAAIIVLIWLLGVGLMLIRRGGGLSALAALERRPYQPLPPAWQQKVEQLRAALGIGRAVVVRLSDEVLTPFAARLLRPVVWLPLSLLTRAPAEQIEALLAHELAHIARRDWLWNGVQCVIEALLFFHPAAWWLGRRIRQEREHACDDLAVAACGDAIALAEALAALECARHAPSRLFLAANGGSLMQRITRILSGPPSRARWRSLALAGALTVSGVLLVTQIGLAAGRFPDLEVRASTAGPLGPGDYREIRAGGVDKQRFYRESVDAQGRRSERYEENGEARPIDAGVRRWLAEISRLSLTPPMPSVDVGRDPALVALIAARPEVIAKVGTPAAATSRPINGNVRLDGADGANGEADIEIELEGPKGHATVAVEAAKKDHVWTLRSLDMRS